jgi:hypothetical protein
MVSHCTTIPITCSRVLNSSPGRLDLGGLGFKSPWGVVENKQSTDVESTRIGN